METIDVTQSIKDLALEINKLREEIEKYDTSKCSKSDLHECRMLIAQRRALKEILGGRIAESLNNTPW